MREQRVHARLRTWWIEDELRLAIFLRDGIVVLDCYASIRIPSCRDSYAENHIIRGEHEQCRTHDGQR